MLTARRTDPLLKFADHWRWMIAAGVAIVALGVYAMAHILTATVATLLIVGATMIAAGIVQIAVAFRVAGMGRALFWALAGALYVAAGVVAFFNPLLASVLFTLILAASLIVSGISRILFGLGLKPERGWDWSVAAGVISLVAGLVVAIGWPANVWTLGVLLAVDIIAQGAALLAIGLVLRAQRQQ